MSSKRVKRRFLKGRAVVDSGCCYFIRLGFAKQLLKYDARYRKCVVFNFK
ncbi:hypothetical protein ACWNX2_00165 [Candidatus Vidania fulgoroideorum]